MSRSRVAARAVQTFSESFEAVVANVATVVQGKDEAIRLALLCLVAEGHLLIEDVPGVGKTSLAKAIAGSLDCTWRRIQFTPDLLPSDVTGVSVYNRVTGAFEFRPGGIFANLVVGDEINRASPKTQSALLEAMEERQVTVDGTTYRLAAPVHGDRHPEPGGARGHLSPAREPARPLPHAHRHGLPRPGGRDRHPRHPRPDRPGGVAAAGGVGGRRPDHDRPGLGHPRRPQPQGLHRRRGRRHPRAIPNWRSACRPAPPSACCGRPGPGPRRSGRDYVVPDDLKALALPVLEHRLALTGDAQLRGVSRADLLLSVLGSVSVPAAR